MKSVRQWVVLGLVCLGLSAMAEEVKKPAPETLFDIRGNGWRLSYQWKIGPVPVIDFLPNKTMVSREYGTSTGAWAQAGNAVTWIYTNGVNYRGKMTSVYAMTGTMNSVSGNAGVWTATRTNAPGVFNFGALDYPALEGTKRQIAVFRSCGSDGTVSVKYATAAGSAVAGQDYVPKYGTLTWTNHDVAPKIIKVEVVSDGVNEVAESFKVILKQPAGGFLGSIPKATVTIQSHMN